MEITAFDLAQRFSGIREVPGAVHNPQIVAMLRLDAGWVKEDEVPWCSAFVNYVAWLLRLPRSKSLGARSWLGVGVPVTAYEAKPGFDVVILERGAGQQPGPDVIAAPGHVGFYAGMDTSGRVMVLGGNQSNSVTIAPFVFGKVLGFRRLHSS